jgi:hypothetical protein
MSKSSANFHKPVRFNAKKKMPIHSSRYARIIDEAAYYRAEQQRLLPEYDVLDWLEAEDEINKHHNKALF